jgi:hypothetical protein
LRRDKLEAPVQDQKPEVDFLNTTSYKENYLFSAIWGSEFKLASMCYYWLKDTDPANMQEP